MSELTLQRQRSRAEVLYCLDVLVRHINDEEAAMDTWLAVGVPDGTLKEWPTDEQIDPFLDLADNEYEAEIEADVNPMFDPVDFIQNALDSALSAYKAEHCAGDYLAPVRFEGKIVA